MSFVDYNWIAYRIIRLFLKDWDIVEFFHITVDASQVTERRRLAAY